MGIDRRSSGACAQLIGLQAGQVLAVALTQDDVRAKATKTRAVRDPGPAGPTVSPRGWVLPNERKGSSPLQPELTAKPTRKSGWGISYSSKKTAKSS